MTTQNDITRCTGFNNGAAAVYQRAVPATISEDFVSQLKLAAGLSNELLDVIHKYDELMPLATVIGVLEIIKAGLLLDGIESTECEE